MPKFNIKAQTIPTVASAYADVLGTTDNQIVEIKNELIVEDNNQRFQIHDDTIEQLAECIARDGQLSPCIVAPLPDGKYELIDGRHRRRAVIKAGLPTTKCIIKTNLSEKEKKTIRLTSNLVRNNDYLPSELAFAYKELAELEDMKTISEETNLSKKKIYRYIRLTNLIEPILNRVDSGAIPVIAAVELSYLSKEEQNHLFEFLLNHSDCKVTTTIARDIKEKPDDLEEIFFGGTTDSGVFSELADKAMEPYRQNHVKEAAAKVDKLSTPENKNESEPKQPVVTAETDLSDNRESTPREQEQTDNLSTPKQDVQASDNHNSPVGNSFVVGKNDLIYLDSDGEAHLVKDIDENVRKIICEYVIKTTNMDFRIFRQAYDSRDILDDWNKNQIKCSHSQTVCEKAAGKYHVAGFAKWNAPKRMFDIEIHGDHYIFLHMVLEKVVRRYIRETYTLERIISVLKEEK